MGLASAALLSGLLLAEGLGCRGGGDGDADVDGDADSDGSDGDAGADSDAPPGIVVLRNDGFDWGGEAGYAGAFLGQGTCWASVFVPEAEHFPFAVRGVEMLLGSGPATEVCAVSVWRVDDGSGPSEQLAEADVELTSSFTSAEELEWVDLETAMPGLPSVEAGAFAIAVCKTAHEGNPTPGYDDLPSAPDRNWIFDGSWEAFTSGDWIMRAHIEPL